MSEQKHAFSIEMNSHKHIQRLLISKNKKDKVVFEGYLGELMNVGLIEDAMLEINCSNGVLRIDINAMELTKVFSKRSS
jgi:hypothetical protein